MEPTAAKKTSIFTCKTCKITEEKPEKAPSGPKELTIKLEPAKNTHMDQKYIVKVGSKTIGFGSRGMSDYTINKS